MVWFIPISTKPLNISASSYSAFRYIIIAETDC
nr:MAG TPA: CptN Toxin-RNA complex, pseudoknot, RNA twist [Caudoviricetes sp.]